MLHKPVANLHCREMGQTCSLQDSGIDTGTFSSNSARPISTLYGAQTRLTLEEILKAGGWTNAQTFAEHNHKAIEGNFEF